MARVTFNTFRQRRNILATAWQDSCRGYCYLSFQDQRYLHDYYRPTEQLAEEDLRQHWVEIPKFRPSLPHCAGKAFRHFELTLALGVYTVQAKPYRKPQRGERQLSVRGVVRPQIDVQKVAKALLKMAREEIKSHNVDDSSDVDV